MVMIEMFSYWLNSFEPRFNVQAITLVIQARVVGVGFL